MKGLQLGMGMTRRQRRAVSAPAIYDLAFDTQSYSGPNGVIDPWGLGLLTHTRTGPILVPDSTGVHTQFGDGVLAINDLGLWRRANTRKNYLRNQNTGEVDGTLGAGGALPTGWAISSTTLTSVTKGTDAATGLAKTAIRINGTSASTGIKILKMASSVAIPAGAHFMLSYWIKVINNLNRDGTTYVQPYCQFGTDAATIGERILNRYTTPTRIKTYCPNPNARTTVSPGIQFSLKSGAVYDFTIEIIGAQFEQIESATADASLPIPNDSTTGTTHNADTFTIASDLLTYLQGGAGFIEVTSEQLRCSGLNYRQDVPIISFGAANALKRSDKGEIASEVTGTPRTYRSERCQFGWTRKQALSWDGTHTSVASDSSKDVATVAAAAPTIASAGLVHDGCISRIRLSNVAMGAGELDAYKRATVDCIAYGATLHGINFAIGAKKQGRTALVLGDWREASPGGMAAGGLQFVDANSLTVWGSGAAAAFDYLDFCNEYRGIGTNSNFIDSNTARVYVEYLLKKNKVDIHYTKGLVRDGGVTKEGTLIRSMVTTKGQVFNAKVWDGADYTGDLMVAAGCSHIVGREAADSSVNGLGQQRNPYNGNFGHNPFTTGTASSDLHQFTKSATGGKTDIVPVSPYVTPGDNTSGLLPGIIPDTTTVQGAADGQLQAYCMRLSINTTTSDTNWVAMNTNGVQPPGYDPTLYEMMGRHLAGLTTLGYTAVSMGVSPVGSQYNLKLFLLLQGSAQNYDVNQQAGMGVDFIGANWGAFFQELTGSDANSYPEASYEDRELSWKGHDNYAVGLFYWLAYSGDPRIPAQIASDAATVGWRKDFYLDPHENDQAHHNPQLYIREAYRMIGWDSLNMADLLAPASSTARLPYTIGNISYPVDSHHGRRMPLNSGGVDYTVPEGNMSQPTNTSAPMSAHYVLPQPSECTNLVSGFACSAKHTGFGAIRMELPFAQSGQSMGIAAGLMLNNDYEDLQDFFTDHYTDIIKPALIASGIPCPLTN